MNNHKNPQTEPETQEMPEMDASAETADTFDNIEEAADETESLKSQLDQTQTELEKQKKEYLFLMAEFDNFRKRTLKEKSELLRNGAESAMRGLLPVVDDFERGLEAIKDATDADAVKEGMTLIYNKFVNISSKMA